MRSLLKVSLILALCTAALADVAPDPGYTNVPANLILESDADLSNFRFVLESPVKVEEIKINSGAPTVIEAAGRAGAARYVKLIAIPLEDLGRISGDLNSSLLESQVERNEFPNAKVLLAHNFQATIPVTEKSGWQHPVYRISIDGGGISAAPVSGGSPSGGRLTYSIWQIVWPVAVAGTLLAAGVAIAGIWLIRRNKKIV